MKILKLKNLENKPIKVKTDEIDPKFKYKGLAQPYFRASAIAPSGFGKTNSVLQWFNRMKDDLHQVYVITPTIFNDNKQQSVFGLPEEPLEDNYHIYTEPNVKTLVEIFKRIKEYYEDYKESFKIRKAFERWRKLGFDESLLEPKDLVLLESVDFDMENLKYKYKTKPNQLLIIDDCMESELLNSRAFTSMTIKLRHFCANCIILLQSFKGLKPPVRRNQTIFMIFRCPDQTQLKSIFEEVGMFFEDYDDFLNTYKYCVEGEKHNFMYCDLNDDRFGLRKNFDEIILKENVSINKVKIDNDKSSEPKSEPKSNPITK